MFKIQLSDFKGECVVNAIFTGEFDRALVIKFIDKMAEYEVRCPGNKLLVDCAGVSKVSIDFEDLKSIVKFVRENDKRQGKTAFVVGADVSRVLMAKLFVDLVGVFRPNQEKTFRRLDHAIGWLCPNDC